MKLYIKNDITVENPSYEVIRYCEDKLMLDNPDYIIAERLGRYVDKMDKKLQLYIQNGNRLIIPYGCLQDIWHLSKGADYECQFPRFKGSLLEGHINLYGYQENALKRILEGKNGVLEAPCGSGKTNIGLEFIKRVGGKALWLTHTKKLLTQSMERAKEWYQGEFGTITEGKVNIGRDITFATVQTMRTLDTRIYENEFDIVVVDECHHCVGTPTKVMQFYKVLTNLNCRYKIGLSATLTRSDKMINCVYYIIGPKLHTITEEEVGNKIIKAKHIKVDIDLEYKIEDYCLPDGMIDYNKMITLLSSNDERNEIIISQVLEFYDLGKKQMILCSRVNQILWLHKELSKNLLKVSMITGKVRQNKRDYDADVIIATYALAKEGLDIPDLDVVHFATPQKDKSIVKQSAGRVERNYEGKEQPLVIDYVDTNIDYCVNTYKIRKRILK